MLVDFRVTAADDKTKPHTASPDFELRILREWFKDEEELFDIGMLITTICGAFGKNISLEDAATYAFPLYYERYQESVVQFWTNPFRVVVLLDGIAIAAKQD